MLMALNNSAADTSRHAEGPVWVGVAIATPSGERPESADCVEKVTEYH
jgi:hypothetical protein